MEEEKQKIELDGISCKQILENGELGEEMVDMDQLDPVW